MKSKLILPIAIIISFCLGYMIKTSTIKPQKNNELNPVPEKIVALHTELETPQNCEHELEESKKFYEKAFVLFLANLGIKLTREQQSKLDQITINPKSYLKEDKQKSPQSKPASQLATYGDDFRPRPDFKKYLLNNKGVIEHIENEELLNQAQTFILKDPALSYARSKFVEKFSDVKRFNGLYSGKLYLFAGDKKGETHDVEMSVDFQLSSQDNSDDQADGSFQLKLSANGATYNNSSSNGGNGNIKVIKNIILIKAGPERFLSFINNDLTTANFYSDSKHVGVAKLRRIDQ